MNQKRSGGQIGQTLETYLRRYLGNNVYNLADTQPEYGLIACKNNMGLVDFRVLVCGGDGTAAWVLHAIDSVLDELDFYRPPVAIPPLGTGNDLARMLNWGSTFDADESMVVVSAECSPTCGDPARRSAAG